MEVVQSSAEVKYTLTVPQFSYQELGETFTTDFQLSVNGVRTSWQATLTLFMKENVCPSQDPMNRNIGIALECLQCNINRPDFKVYCRLQGKDQHEKRLARSSDGGYKWQGILVSRMTLDVFKLLKDDVLTAHLRFVVSENDLAKGLDSREDLILHLLKIQKTGVYSDIEVLTSDGMRLPAHCAILSTRSNLLLQKFQSTTETRECENASTIPLPGTRTPSAKTSPTRAEIPLDSTFEGVASTHRSVTSMSPDSSSTNCGKSQISRLSIIQTKVSSLPTIIGSPVRCLNPSRTPSKPGMTNNKRCLNNSTMSPSKLPIPNTTLPKKDLFSTSQRLLSPSQRLLSPSQRLLSPSQRLLPPSQRLLSPTKRSLSPSTRPPSKRFMTPSKLLTSSKQLSTPSPTIAETTRRRMLRAPEKKHDREPSDTFHTEPLSSDRDICFPAGESSTPLKQLEIRSLKSPTKKEFVKVNMSSSVTQQLLEWIYIGDCSDLGHLARPLLVAGLRHEVNDLVWACENHLAAELSPTAAPDMLLLAHKYGAARLREAALQYALQHAAEVTVQPSWSTLAASAPSLISEFSLLLAQQRTQCQHPLQSNIKT
nr:uncharacterized protein LOC123758613 [Procambarus clarkii]